MAFIIKNPKVKDYFARVKYQDAISQPKGITPLYEDGNFILLEDYKLNLDYDFLNSISLEDALEKLEVKDRKRLQKLPYQDILSLNPCKLKNKFQEVIYQTSFQGDKEKLFYFQKQVDRGHKLVLKLFDSLFPQYQYFQLNGTWRFLPTLFENLHWDNFPNLDDRHQARIFVNLDRSHRIWHTSHVIDEFVDENYVKFNLSQLKNENPNEIINFMDKNVLGGMPKRCLDGFERHCIAFEQGDIWFADSRLVAHQIYHGNRAIIYMFHIKPEFMDNPDKRYDSRIKKIHEKYSDLN